MRFVAALVIIAIGAALPLALVYLLPGAEPEAFDWLGLLLLTVTTAEAAAIAAIMVLRPYRPRYGAEARGLRLVERRKSRAARRKRWERERKRSLFV